MEKQQQETHQLYRFRTVVPKHYPIKHSAQNVTKHNTRLLWEVVKTMLDLLDVISSDEVSTITVERWMTHMGKLGGKSVVWYKSVNR